MASPRRAGAGPPQPDGAPAPAPARIAPETPPLELSGRDYAISLLRLAAEIEHGLMVQYLFAAYSLDPPGAPAAQRPLVRRWQEAILGIAKEETLIEKWMSAGVIEDGGWTACEERRSTRGFGIAVARTSTCTTSSTYGPTNGEVGMRAGT